jgi:Arm DNA-binding domain
MKLTLRTIQAAPAEDQEYVLWDHDLSCFGLRVRPGGGKTFIARTRVGRGRDARKVTFTIGKPDVMTVEDARRKARALIAEAADGKTPEIASPKTPAGPKTVGDLCELWL